PVRLIGAGRVELGTTGAGRFGEVDVARRGAEQDADHVRTGDRPQAGPRVVMAEDELVALAVEGVAVGAVGAHPDPVAEAVPVDDPADLGTGPRRRGPERADEQRGEREQGGNEEAA